MEQIPVVSVNYVGLEKNPGLKFTPKLIFGVLYAVLYGDLFMRVTNATRPYEAEPGSVEKLYRKWNEIARKNVIDRSFSQFKKNVKQIVKEFDEIPLLNVEKPKVGVVGEILVKYHPNANNDIVGIIESEGGSCRAGSAGLLHVLPEKQRLQLRKDGGKLFHAHDFQNRNETDLSVPRRDFEKLIASRRFRAADAYR